MLDVCQRHAALPSRAQGLRGPACTRAPAVADSGVPSRLRLLVVFAGLYFVQGLLDPETGLLRQPVRQDLERAGLGVGAIGGALALASLPWSFKPLYGLWFDCVPLRGERRRSWLALASAAALLAALALAIAAPGPGPGLLAALAVITLAVACGDVLADALMVEVGQARGLTGQIQSVQWTAMYAATILAGVLGGRLTGPGQLPVAALVCAAAAATCLVMTVTAIDEPPRPDLSPGPDDGLLGGLRALARAARTPELLVPLAFLALWSFVPFHGTVLDIHFTRVHGVDEAAYGDTLALHAGACMLASALYGLYCRRVALVPLVHASIALAIVGELAYLLAWDATSLGVASVIAGLAYMTGSIITLDLAARVCPPRVAGSMFALLMAASNVSLTVATWLGGHAYEALSAARGGQFAFAALVGASALLMSACWLLMPALRRALTAAPT
jgi:predicted MFS family arabinose efflux permease